MSRASYTIRADKPLPGAWLAVLEALMEEGTASTAELQEACAHYAPTTISGVASGMHQWGFLQYAPGKQWGLTNAGITAALKAEEEANAVPNFDAAAKAEVKPKSQAIAEANAMRQRTKKRLAAEAAHIGAMRRQGEVLA